MITEIGVLFILSVLSGMALAFLAISREWNWALSFVEFLKEESFEEFAEKTNKRA